MTVVFVRGAKVFRSEDYLPSRFHAINEFYDFCVANDPEFDNAEEIKDKGLNNRFPNTADLDGVRIWERILGLTPGPNDTLDDRRFRIISNIQKRAPFTWAELHRMFTFLCGEGTFELIRDSEFYLKVYLDMDSDSKLQSVIKLLEEVVPMHIFIDLTVKCEMAALVDFASTGNYTAIIETPINTDKQTATVYHGQPYLYSVTIETGLGEENG